MKKLVALIISMSMALSMAACQGAKSGDKKDGAGATEAAVTTEAKVNNKEQAVETADQFMKCLAEGDIEHLGDYCTEEVIKEMKLDSMEESLTSSFGAANPDNPYTPSEEALASLKNAVSTILKAVIDRYELGDVEGEDTLDSYDVPVTIYVRNMQNAGELDMNTIMSQSLTEDDYAQIMKLAQEEGQNSMYDYLMINVMPKMFEKMAEEISKIESTPENGSLTVEKQADGKWLVTKTSGMNSMVPGTEGGAAAPSTEGEAAPAEAATQQ